MANPFAELINKPVETDSWRWGNVVGVSPLRVQLDGDTEPLVATPDALVVCAVGDRVRCHIHNRRVTVIGRSGGSFSPALYGLIDGGRYQMSGRTYVPEHSLTAWNGMYVSPANLTLNVTVPAGWGLLCAPDTSASGGGFKMLSMNGKNSIRYVSTTNQTLKHVVWQLVFVGY